MLVDLFSSLCDFFIKITTLSDSAFHNLLGLLLVITFIRLLPPLHRMMSRELNIRNEIIDLAEEDGCKEFDVFMHAIEYSCGHQNQKKAERDFSVYLFNWPEHYIVPYYMRCYLKMRKDKKISILLTG